jgi:hypothetical protein
MRLYPSRILSLSHLGHLLLSIRGYTPFLSEKCCLVATLVSLSLAAMGTRRVASAGSQARS